MSPQLRLLLWLRYRLMLRSRGRTLALLVILLVLTPMSFGLGAGVFSATRHLAAEQDPALVTEWVHLLLFFFYAMLVALPVLGFGANEFYDVTKLFHFPVGHRTVFLARTIGAMGGGVVLFFLPSLIGLAVGLGGGARVALNVALLLVFLFHVTAVGQLIQLALLNLLRSRRFRELSALVAALLSGAVYVSFRLLTADGHALENIRTVLSRGVSDWLAPIPSYWVSSLLAPTVEVGSVLIFLLVFLPLTGLVVVLAAGLQERAFHGELKSAAPKTRTGAKSKARFLPFPLSRLPGPVQAVALAQLRQLRREPTVRTMLIQQFIFFLFPLVFAFWGLRERSVEGTARLLEAAVYAFLFVESVLVLNLFGLDGPGICHLLATPVRRSSILFGKAVAYLILWGGLNTVLLTGVIAGMRALSVPVTPGRFLELVMGAFAALLVLLGMGGVTSALLPMRMTARGRRALSQSGAMGEGCTQSIYRMLALMVLAVLMAPVYLMISVGRHPALALTALLYGAVLFFAGMALGSRIFRSREEEIIAVLARSRD